MNSDLSFAQVGAFLICRNALSSFILAGNFRVTINVYLHSAWLFVFCFFFVLALIFDCCDDLF